ncbi:(2Fe-2S)-binding protein [Streptomyces physcomitrii]|uniref:(2Fe-2S)-binding protein n=1 Tax=Streptomyces physcomitrii TaxID=2724184 RepID=UPI0033DD0D31
MTARLVPAADDATGRRERPLRITVDGEALDGFVGQSIAGVLLAAGRLAWRRGPSGAPRGVFCGIGVCFDCLVRVNGEPDVRACRRRARDGDTVLTQSRAGGGEEAGDEGASGSSAALPAPAEEDNSDTEDGV